MPSLPGKLYINLATMPATVKPSGSALQSIACKISRNNHKIAKQRQQDGFHTEGVRAVAILHCHLRRDARNVRAF